MFHSGTSLHHLDDPLRSDNANSTRARNVTARNTDQNDRVLYVAIARDREVVASTIDAVDSTTAPLTADHPAIILGKRMIAKKDSPGWDELSWKSGYKKNSGPAFRAFKLPVHDMNGTTSFVVVAGRDFPPERVQAFTEKLAMMLRPTLEGSEGGASAIAADTAHYLGEVLEQQLEQCNNKGAIQRIQNQVDQVRALMANNVEMMLEREEQLDAMAVKAGELSKAAARFKKNTKKIRRWHLWNQVKWGVALGTVVSASVAVPIAVLVAV